MTHFYSYWLQVPNSWPDQSKNNASPSPCGWPPWRWGEWGHGSDRIEPRRVAQSSGSKQTRQDCRWTGDCSGRGLLPLKWGEGKDRSCFIGWSTKFISIPCPFLSKKFDICPPFQVCFSFFKFHKVILLMYSQKSLAIWDINMYSNIVIISHFYSTKIPCSQCSVALYRFKTCVC